ncbi:LOW QUALITY PROTEIN: olfactory receptor 1L6-like [Dugong dugon]
MALRNHSTITEFILIGLSADPHIEALLFVLFLVVYLLTMIGNLMMLLIRADSCLHKPMYFFLSNLSFLDLCFSSVTLPKLLEDLLSEKKTISVEGCLAQVFFVFFTSGTEACLLSVMAYDRYVAICHPLLYGQVMSNLSVKLVLASCSLASLNAVVILLLAINMDFCEAQTIHHFTCELPALFPLSCSDISNNINTLLSASLLHGLETFILIFLSYVHIISTILSISSTTGRSKAFSTCSSHLIAVVLFFASGFLCYLMPPTGSSLDLLLSLQYSVVTALMNPLIYSLKNKEVKAAVKKTLGKIYPYMALRNHSTITKFILLRLSADPHIEALLFVLFLVIYLLTLMGNLVMLLVIRADSCLHKPMYFFLSNLSFLDLCFSSVTLPKLLEDFLSEKKTISVEGCMAQVFFVFITAGTEAFLLSMMAYDRYAAICHPLLYGQLMSNQLCVRLLLTSWGLASLNLVVIVLLAINLDFCEAQTIHHYICELPSLFPLSCSDTSNNINILICATLLHGLETFLPIFISYARIISTILSISSTTGKQAFSTCSSHLIAVILFFGSGLVCYLMPTSGSSLDLLASLQYSVVTPMLNPLIYSLKNKDVKTALKRMLEKYL